MVRDESPWRSDQWVVMLEVGFRVNFVIVSVIVLCRLDSPNPGPWDYSYNTRGVSAAAFSLEYR